MLRVSWSACVLLGLLLFASLARAQEQSPINQINLSGTQAYTWTEEGSGATAATSNVIQLNGPVTIELDQSRLTAENAVMWITPLKGLLADQNRFEIALLGNAKMELPGGITRTGKRLFVDGRARGVVRVTAPRAGGDQSDSEIYQSAVQLRPVPVQGVLQQGGHVIVDEPLTTQPTTKPTDVFKPTQFTQLSADLVDTTNSNEGKVVALLKGNVVVIQQSETGDLLELQADQAVIFTAIKSLTNVPQADRIKLIEQAAEGVYLEGDVRIHRTPKETKEGPQTLTAQRAYYDFLTDRAVLTEVVMHTLDPKTNTPIIVRGKLVRQLSANEYTAEKSQISTSSFHMPSYSMGAQSIYIRQTNFDDPVTGVKTQFEARDATFRLGDTPVFYLPVAAGTVVQNGPLRHAQVGHRSDFGFIVESEWGLFESLGQLPPRGVDASFKVDGYTDRGPATGFNAKYIGGFVSETTLEPWSFSGNFDSYLVYDTGTDDLGKKRTDVDPAEDVRGFFYWQHQHFFPDNWQVQLQGGYISDPTFMEQWFKKDFRTHPPYETSLYVKHQEESEAFTFLTSIQPMNFATSAEVYQERAEVERPIEFSYHRIGDSFFGDRTTFFSDNTVSALRFDPSEAKLKEDLGFGGSFRSPGIPSFGQTGTPDDINYRGDFRQELNFPFSMDKFRVVPYVTGRYTSYTESVEGGSAERVYMGTGIRATTAFWRVDDSVQSDLFDLHRLRHVVEPEINFYTSAQSKDRNEILIYDEPIDAVTDITALQLALNQRWQTKRGGPGRWRSVDFFTWNTSVNSFFSQPPDRELDPTNFRGLFYSTLPETSIPRNSVVSDINWRVSDFVTVNGDVNYNLDESNLATASIGANVRQSDRLAYRIELRHIGIEDGNDGPDGDFIHVPAHRFWLNDHDTGPRYKLEDQELIIFGFDYELTAKYRFAFATNYDIAQKRNDTTSVTLIRHFDRFYASFTFRVDTLDGDTGVFFNVWPEGLQPGANSGAANRFLSQ